jgi:hypothetical protein
LNVGFIAEFSFPSTEGGLTLDEDKAIPLFPDCPTCYNEELHEEIMGRLPLGLLLQPTFCINGDGAPAIPQ